jgi:geranylgeranyl diphosphate synthase, type II
MPFACALEMIHTYSLIHDDLPSMDNDDFRRGRPTCHKAYGEAMALLAGDTLLNRAFEVMLDAVALTDPGTLEAARIIAAASGSSGMIGGQALDLDAESKIITAGELRLMHSMKTGALLKAPVMAAAALAGAEEGTRRILAEFADKIGLAFQIKDDILDATADLQTLGKTAGKDQRDQKMTYVSLFGLDEARRLLSATMEQALDALAVLGQAGYQTDFLAGLADFLLVRAS